MDLMQTEAAMLADPVDTMARHLIRMVDDPAMRDYAGQRLREIELSKERIFNGLRDHIAKIRKEQKEAARG